MEKKRIRILGATGSVGKSTLDLIAQNPKLYDVKVLTCDKNVKELARLAKLHQADIAVCFDENYYAELKSELSGTDIKVKAGHKALLESCEINVDWTMSAITGIAGLEPTIRSVQSSKILALANKETIVSAGPLFMNYLQENNCLLLPVDSEHNAIYQSLYGQDRSNLDSITLTASGGPFREYTSQQLAKVTVLDALKHPNWKMGDKITIDSATLMNKGLEVIETHFLFDIHPNKIDVVIHPESIIHSFVHFKDGSILSQLGCPDMRIPISFCLGYPNRLDVKTEKLSLKDIQKLHFEIPNTKLFPSLRLAYESLNIGKSAPTVLNAANEVAVDAFLNHKISFMKIPHIIEKVCERMSVRSICSFSDVLDVDHETRENVQSIIL